MALRLRFLKNKEDNSIQNAAEIKMHFVIGDTKYYQMNTSDHNFYIAEDSSLLYNGLHGDFSVLLGGNWRFELIVDSSTGLCTQMQSFLNELEVTYTSLQLPKSKHKDLYFVSEEAMKPGCGCHYFPFANRAFWDEEKKILCYGDVNSNGEAVEFTSKTIAVIENKQLMCVYLVLDDINGKV